MDKYDWIVGICSSGADGVKLFRFYGSKDEMKQKLLSLINEDKENDPECWDYGTECVDEIEAEDNGLEYELYGYGCYTDYHIDYTAKEFAHVNWI